MGRRRQRGQRRLLYGRNPRKRERSRAVRFEKERVGECQGGELNSRPRAYESPALPLSYPGLKGAKLNRIAQSVNATKTGIKFSALSFRSKARNLAKTR